MKAFFFLNFILLLSTLSCPADQLILRNGTTVNGTITGAADGAVTVTTVTDSGGSATQPFNFTDITSVTMTSPADFTKAQTADPATRVTLLTPLVNAYQGLPADWVIDAMTQLAESYVSQNQPDKAQAIYDKINQLYPNSSYQIAAQAGKAMIALKAGKTADALADLKPYLDQANASISISPSDARLYAQVFFLQGQALETQKKLSAALESYLTVKTLFYQNPALATQAEAAAQQLRSQNPGLSID